MDSLQNVILDIREYFYGGIATLPLTLAGTILLLGLFTANYAMLFFLLGYLVGVPSAMSILNLLADSYIKESPSQFRIKQNSVCQLVIPFSTLSSNSSKEEIVLCSNGTAMIGFFIGYIMTNAIQILRRNPEENADEKKVMNRKTSMWISIVCIALFALMMIRYRLIAGCETMWGFIFFVGFAIVGYLWYTFLSKYGNDRISDMFGIANRMMVDSAMKEASVCFPV